ncbi:hypothetical protein L2E82_10347 [Cichorium intybus]|uniref:Uncharacterized protein n=1 Tax=Cichorium intybus TaxID=13427 RepID=A0ACB9GA79_CICIN|nr:hypothetical protein L2E82_10347 [Cichorium intybus]
MISKLAMMQELRPKDLQERLGCRSMVLPDVSNGQKGENKGDDCCPFTLPISCSFRFLSMFIFLTRVLDYLQNTENVVLQAKKLTKIKKLAFGGWFSPTHSTIGCYGMAIPVCELEVRQQMTLTASVGSSTKGYGSLFPCFVTLLLVASFALSL